MAGCARGGNRKGDHDAGNVDSADCELSADAAGEKPRLLPISLRLGGRVVRWLDS